VVRHHPRKHRKKKKARQPSKIEDQVQRKRSLTPTYLLPLALITFKVGCHIEHSLHRIKVALTIECLPKLVAFTAATQLPYQVPSIRFDTISFVIGVDIFSSITLGNHPDQFKDLEMHDDTEVEGIKGGLDIKGTGTFKFHIKDDKGGVHLIKIPNSKYILDLKVCLLLSQHWGAGGKRSLSCPERDKDGGR
jgi:hypothetical protein